MRGFYYHLVWLVLVTASLTISVWRYADGDEKQVVWIVANALVLLIVGCAARREHIEANTVHDGDGAGS